jgi:hypothetical protein
MCSCDPKTAEGEREGGIEGMENLLDGAEVVAEQPATSDSAESAKGAKGML